MTVRKWFLKLQEEIEASQGLQGIFDCRIETKIMFPPLPASPHFIAISDSSQTDIKARFNKLT